MRLAWILLPILAQGAVAQFKKEPQPSYVVRMGQDVTLECETRDPSSCAWKTEDTQLNLSGFMTKHVPEIVDISARDENSETDCTIIIHNIDDRYDGKYTCAPFMSGGSQDATVAEVIVAKKPSRLQFVAESAGQSVLEAPVKEPTSITCEASGARPKAELAWYLGVNQIYDGIQEEDVVDPETKLATTRSTLTHAFRREDNGGQLKCVANHAGYAKDEAGHEVEITIDVHYAPYRPEGNSIGKIYGFTAQQAGDVTVNFTANPPPTLMSWKVGDATAVSVGGQSLDGRFTASQLETIDREQGKYALTLTIDPIMVEDQSKTFELRLQNAEGSTELEFSIGTGPAPPPAAMGNAAIAGIVVGAIVLILLIGVVAFGRSRGKWCFAANSDSRNNRLLKSDKEEGDVEKAQEKEEKRELTKPDVDADGDAPPKKEGEVVYAELVLNSDGVKTEVRPSAERTEYAVIVPPTAQNGDQPQPPPPPPPANNVAENVDNREAE